MIPEHIPVLRDEAVAALVSEPDGVYLDCTFGRGGYAQAILARLGTRGRLIAMDQDIDAVAAAQPLAANDSRFSIHHGNFCELSKLIQPGSLQGVVADLGTSSPQLDQPQRGFSFREDGPLDMRMNQAVGESVAQYLAHVDEQALAQVLWLFGEERFSRRIARAVVQQRAEQPLLRTQQLVDLVCRCIPFREANKHPATRTFQALRIHVNDELGALRKLLSTLPEYLQADARAVFVSFHSLEDRIVKHAFRGRSMVNEKSFKGPRGLLQHDTAQTWRVIGKPVRPSDAEIAMNPRSRSATLRIAERCGL